MKITTIPAKHAKIALITPSGIGAGNTAAFPSKFFLGKFGQNLDQFG